MLLFVLVLLSICSGCGSVYSLSDMCKCDVFLYLDVCVFVEIRFVSFICVSYNLYFRGINLLLFMKF